MEMELPINEALRSLRLQALLREAILLICVNCGVEDPAAWEHGSITVIEETGGESESFLFCSYKCLTGWFL